jgi:hypothetical protein
METELITNKVLFNKLNNYFKDNIRTSLINKERNSEINGEVLIVITKEDLFYCIEIGDENVSSFILKDDNSIDLMIIEDLCFKQINDLYICYFFELKYIFARNEYNVYYYDIEYGVMKEYISEEKIIDMCCGHRRSILLTQSGKVYDYVVNREERENSEKYIYSESKSFKNYSFENEKIVMISCGGWHSLALTESGRVFGWGSNWEGQLGVNVRNTSEPIIIEMNDLKIKKISCGNYHSLLLSRDGNIYAFGLNCEGEVGNGMDKPQRVPIKLELNNNFIDIASHPYYHISMSQSIDGIYYVWGLFEDKRVLRPQSTKHKTFEDILISSDFIYNIKTFEKLIEFKCSFIRTGFYSECFKEIKMLGSGSFGSVFQVKSKEWRDYAAIKKIEFTSVDKNEIN